MIGVLRFVRYLLFSHVLKESNSAAKTADDDQNCIDPISKHEIQQGANNTAKADFEKNEEMTFTIL